MTWCTSGDENRALDRNERSSIIATKCCPSCGYPIPIQSQKQAIIRALPSLPAGVRFDPTDQELLKHLEGKAKPQTEKLHPLVDEFIPTLQGDNGICYTHPEKLPGVEKDGQVRHFFHRPSKAYTTGTRKRRKVRTEAFGGETRWHKTGKTKPVFSEGQPKGFKKILVLYTNYGKQRKPEKTNWVMHQYHLGASVEEKEGELVVSKVFYQTHPRISSGTTARQKATVDSHGSDGGSAEFYGDAMDSFDQHVASDSPHLIPNFSIHSHGSSLLS